MTHASESSSSRLLLPPRELPVRIRRGGGQGQGKGSNCCSLNPKSIRYYDFESHNTTHTHAPPFPNAAATCRSATSACSMRVTCNATSNDYANCVGGSARASPAVCCSLFSAANEQALLHRITHAHAAARATRQPAQCAQSHRRRRTCRSFAGRIESSAGAGANEKLQPGPRWLHHILNPNP